MSTATTVRSLVLTALFGLAAAACTPREATPPPWRLIEPWVGWAPAPTVTPTPTATADLLSRLLPPTPLPGSPPTTPTPDPLRAQPTYRVDTEWHIVRPGESIGVIAWRYEVGAGQIVRANGIVNPDLLSVGQVLVIPPPIVEAAGPADKIVPDSGLVYGPAAILFDLNGFVGRWPSHLAAYTEEVEGVRLSGPGIVQLAAQRYSVDPRLLLTLIEWQGGWVRSAVVRGEARLYPAGFRNPGQEGLWSQLSWAADQLNTGYYRWRAGWAGPFVFTDGRVAPAGAGINAGTAGVQHLFSQFLPPDEWRRAMSPGGVEALYRELFGDPFLVAIEPLVPSAPSGPVMQLPFEPGAVWSFTGGPHSAWGTGSGWAALDFAPPGFALGCVASDAWITAVADGPVIRSENGEVVQDLDGDGHEQTGWVVLYMHVEARDRVATGTWLRPGDRIGHPSCEGGISSGTHLHLARKYNGEWIPADGPLPFLLDGWRSAGLGGEYDGTLTRGEVRLEACACRNEENQVAR